MSGLLGRLLGSEKAIEVAAKGVDSVFFTKQEKSEKWIDTLKAYEPFKIAQRLLALMFSGVFLLVFLIGVVLMVVSIWSEKVGVMGKEIIDLNIKTLGVSVALIVGFYFAAGATEGVISKFQKRRAEKRERREEKK